MRLADDAALHAAFDREMEEFLQRPPVPMAMSPAVVWVLVAQLQLASRHPENTGPTAAVARRWAQAVMQFVALPPAMQAVYEAGWDPAEDVLRAARGTGAHDTQGEEGASDAS